MNKLNYLLIFAIIILLIGSVFFCFNLEKQNSEFEKDFKKEVSELKKGQVEQEEDVKDLQELLILSWKEYRDYGLGFSFRYPPSAVVCEGAEFFEKTVLSLGIRLDETCAEGKEYRHPAQMYFTIGENTYGYQTAEEAFCGCTYHTVDKSSNPQLGYFKIGGLDAYGGGINNNPGEGNYALDGYEAVILKNNYIINIHGGYERFRFLDGKSIGKDPIVDAVVFSFDFYNHFMEDRR